MTPLSRYPIAPGDAGVLATLNVMASEAAAAATSDPWIYTTAARILQQSAGGVRGIRDYLALHCVFVDDPPDSEWVTSPGRQLRQILEHGRTIGDCDDVATLGAALALSLRIPVQFVVVAFPNDPTNFAHVWAQLWDGAAWIDLDVTREAQGIPELPQLSRVEVFDVHSTGSIARV